MLSLRRCGRMVPCRVSSVHLSSTLLLRATLVQSSQPTPFNRQHLVSCRPFHSDRGNPAASRMPSTYRNAAYGTSNELSSAVNMGHPGSYRKSGHSPHTFTIGGQSKSKATKGRTLGDSADHSCSNETHSSSNGKNSHSNSNNNNSGGSYRGGAPQHRSNLFKATKTPLEAILSEWYEEHGKAKESKELVPVSSSSLVLTEVPIPAHLMNPVPLLADGLRKVIGSNTCIMSKDPRTGLQNIDEFDFSIEDPSCVDWSKIPPFITSSRDVKLTDLAKGHKCKFICSTSSSTSALAHIYFAFSDFRPVSIGNDFSEIFHTMPHTHTRAARKAASIVLRNRSSDDHEMWGFDTMPTGSPKPNQILIELGKTLECKLTMESDEYAYKMLLRGKVDQSHHQNSEVQVEKEKKYDDDGSLKEAHLYVKSGQMMFRAQLDCHDPLLKTREKVFDLKTRATLPIRLDVIHYKDYLDYRLLRQKGLFSSFEREWYDMARSAFLKYSLQVRIGKMAGVMVAYHNTQEIFGFEYIPLKEMDAAVFGSSALAKMSFNVGLRLLDQSLNTLVDEFKSYGGRKNNTLRVTMKAVPGKNKVDYFIEMLEPARPEYKPLDDVHTAVLHVDEMMDADIIKQLRVRDIDVSNVSRAVLCAKLEDAVGPPLEAQAPDVNRLESLAERGFIHKYELLISTKVNGGSAAMPLSLKASDKVDVAYSFEKVAQSPYLTAHEYRLALIDWQMRDEDSPIVVPTNDALPLSASTSASLSMDLAKDPDSDLDSADEDSVETALDADLPAEGRGRGRGRITKDDATSQTLEVGEDSSTDDVGDLPIVLTDGQKRVQRIMQEVATYEQQLLKMSVAEK